MLIRQLTEPQLLTCSRTVNSAGIQVQWMEDHLGQLHSDSELRWYPAQWTKNHLAQLHLNTWVFPAFSQPTQFIIDRNLTEMMIYSGVSYFFWECTVLRLLQHINIFFVENHLKWRKYCNKNCLRPSCTAVRHGPSLSSLKQCDGWNLTRNSKCIPWPTGLFLVPGDIFKEARGSLLVPGAIDG